MKFTTSFAILSTLSSAFAAPTLLAGADALAVVPKVITAVVDAGAAITRRAVAADGNVLVKALDPIIADLNVGAFVGRRAIEGDVDALLEVADPLIAGGNVGFFAGRRRAVAADANLIAEALDPVIAIANVGAFVGRRDVEGDVTDVTAPVHSIPDAVIAVEAQVTVIIGKLNAPGIKHDDAVALILELVAQLEILKGHFLDLKLLNLDALALLGVDGNAHGLAIRIVALVKIILGALLHVKGVLGLIPEIAQVGVYLQVILSLAVGLVAGLDVELVVLLKPVAKILVDLAITLVVGSVHL